MKKYKIGWISGRDDLNQKKPCVNPWVDPRYSSAFLFRSIPLSGVSWECPLQTTVASVSFLCSVPHCYTSLIIPCPL